jgi:hypothetical protein
MQFIINNWYIILAVLAILAASWIAVYRYFKLPSEEQIEKVRNWLLWAVTEAERELGGGTGKLKLRQVYDLFVSRFPWLAPVVSFQRFAELVDDALDEMRKLLKDNRAVQAHVSGEGGTNGEAAQ